MTEHEFWKDLGNIFDAVLNYQKKNVEFNNRFINPWIRLGNIFDRHDQTNDAVQAYKHATEIDPDSLQNWVDLGDAQFKNGAYGEAIEAYSKAVTLDPEAGWPLGNLALCLMTQGKIEESIPIYQKSIDLLIDVKDKAICWNRLGNAYRKLNDYENAFLAFQKADQLDGENTGFNDKLDETPPNTSMVAPEEILEQMIMEQTLEASEAESTAPEVVAESAEEISQLEVEPATLNASQMDTADEPLALEPNMEMKIEEIVEKVIALSLKEADVEESAGENIVAEEESHPILPEKKFDIVQVVEDVIIKIEQAFAEKQSSDATNEQELQGASLKADVVAMSEESAKEIDAAAEINEEVVYKIEDTVSNEMSEQTVQEGESIAEAHEEIAVDVEPAKASEESVQEVETVAETNEGALQIETPVLSEDVSLEVEVHTTNEEAPMEVEAMAAEIAEETKSEVDALVASEVSEEERFSKDAPRVIPSWLVIPDTMKVEEKEIVAKAEEIEELPQAESVTTLSDISQEAVVSELDVNMNVVETYTDPLASQLTTEPSLSDESINETAGQVEVDAEREANVEAQSAIAVAEANLLEESAPVEESSTAVVEEQATEMAYEEYLKDMVEPTSILTDHVDEIHGEAPITKVSKDGEVRIVMDTKNAHVWNELGNIYLNAGACDDSIASYSKAIELDRNFAWPYSNLALAYVQKGRFAEAILLYQRGIELFTSDKDKAITWNRLGNVYRRINDYSNAIASYQTADELDPENATLSLRSSFGLLGNMYSASKPAYSA